MSGRDVIVDTNVFVSARNRQERGHQACRRLLDRIDGGALCATVSTVTIAELRAGILMEEVPTVWRAMLSHFLTSDNYRVEPVNADIAQAAGAIRAASRISLPDALIVATGHLRGVDFLVTQDREMSRRQTVLSVKSPQDLT